VVHFWCIGGKEKLMVSTRAITRLGIVAVGLGIGAALASTPGIATADSSTDWLSSIDTLLASGPLAAADTSATNLAISIDGITLLQEGTAQAYSGPTDFAIAYGAGTTATAYGTGDYAYAEGTDSSATAGGTTAADGAGGTFDSAFLYGDNSTAFAGGTAADPGTFDSAIVIGNSDLASSGGDAAGPGSYDVAYVEGNNLATNGAQGASFLLDILKTYEDGTSSAAADGSNLWTDLVSSFDSSGIAADASNFWTELATLF
jgi:hypothetical protein